MIKKPNSLPVGLLICMVLGGALAIAFFSFAYIDSVKSSNHSAPVTFTPSEMSYTTPPPMPASNSVGVEYDAYKGIIMIEVVNVQKNWEDPKLVAVYQKDQANNALAASAPPAKFTLVKIRYRNTSKKAAVFTDILTEELNLPGLKCGRIDYISKTQQWMFTENTPTYPYVKTGDQLGTYSDTDIVAYNEKTFTKAFAPLELKEGYVEYPQDCAYLAGGTGATSWWGF